LSIRHTIVIDPAPIFEKNNMLSEVKILKNHFHFWDTFIKEEFTTEEDFLPPTSRTSTKTEETRSTDSRGFSRLIKDRRSLAKAQSHEDRRVVVWKLSLSDFLCKWKISLERNPFFSKFNGELV